MSTHNSYRWSITKQLDQGIRGFEFDIHDTWDTFEMILWRLSGKRYKGKFKVGHWWAGHEVHHRRGGNPWGNNLEKWLGKIANWSEKHKDHAPITIFLDIKKDFLDLNNEPPEQFGLIRLDEQIRNALNGSLFTTQDFEENRQPLIRDLQGKIIVVLMSFHTVSREAKKIIKAEQDRRDKKTLKNLVKKLVRSIVIKTAKWFEAQSYLLGLPDSPGALRTRIAYQEKRIVSKEDFDQICLVAFNPEDRDKTDFEPSIETKSFFVTAYPQEKFSPHWNQDKLIRTDYCLKKDGSWPKFPAYVNFPVTDFWEHQYGYEKEYHDWIKF